MEEMTGGSQFSSLKLCPVFSLQFSILTPGQRYFGTRMRKNRLPEMYMTTRSSHFEATDRFWLLNEIPSIKFDVNMEKVVKGDRCISDFRFEKQKLLPEASKLLNQSASSLWLSPSNFPFTLHHPTAQTNCSCPYQKLISIVGINIGRHHLEWVSFQIARQWGR